MNVMIEALVLGIVQGLTEFLPVSSTAHLIIVPWVFAWTGLADTLTFDVALHAGTLAALLICFWRDWVEIIFRKPRFLLMIVAASFPAGVAGVLLNDLVETRLRSPLIIVGTLVIFGIAMLVAERGLKEREFNRIAFSDAMLIGLAQAVALIPGVSRSGITISAGLFLGINREAAARFSFLLSTPAVAGAALLHLVKALRHGGVEHPDLFATGIAVSALTGVLAIKFLLGFFRKHPMNIFAYYRFGLAALILAGVWLRT